MEEKPEGKLTSGGRNLILLGVISIAIAASTTGVSLAIYHNSGDIYLDRSRPGYLPDKEEIENINNSEDEKEYEFPKTGKITLDDIEEYLKHLDVEVKAIDAYGDPFDANLLSDDFLGIKNEE